MWKCASRRLKSLFCKNKYSHNNVTSREARCDQTVDCLLRLSPSIFGHFNGSSSAKNCHTGQFSNQRKENPNSNRNWRLDSIHYNLFDVLQWTSICVLGGILPFVHRKAVINSQYSEKCAFRLLTKYTNIEYLKLLRYFENYLAFQWILPKVKATKSVCEPSGDWKNDSQNKSVIEDLKLQELEKAHKMVIGTLSNFRGSKCMKNGEYSEAICHFEEGAKVHHPSALYNLGVCYEMGWGTNKDYKKAAELYKRASDLGHPTATYNLGVFYVHGLGDLKKDHNEARNLFEIAAKMGQQNALDALGLDDDLKVSYNKKSDHLNVASVKANMECSAESLTAERTTNQKLVNTLLNHVIWKREKFSSFDDSGVIDLSPEDNIVLI